MFSKSIIETPELHTKTSIITSEHCAGKSYSDSIVLTFGRHSCFSIVNFQHIQYIKLEFLLLTLNKQLLAEFLSAQCMALNAILCDGFVTFAL